MADAKITDLNELTTALDGDLLAIVDDPAGAPETMKITTANLFDSLLAVGEIYTNDGTGSQTLTTGSTWYQVTQWDSNGSSDNTTPDQANNRIIAGVTGLYLVIYQMSFSGSANSRYDFQVRWDAGAQVQTQTTRVLGTGGDAGSCSAVGVVDVTAATTDFTLWVRSITGNSRTLTVINSQLVVEKIAST